jgi:hypothetical protein
LRLQLLYKSDWIRRHPGTLEKTNNMQMQSSLLPIVEIQYHAPYQIVLHQQGAQEILLHSPLPQDMGLMSQSSLFSASTLKIQIIYHLSQAWKISPTPTPRLQALFMVDLAERPLLVRKASPKRPQMFGHLWRLREMEESTVCFASM